jgi:putative nucleotidyltransferase with HDIG domain
MSACAIKSPGDITAVILSAGLSTRMGRFKPLLPLGTRRAIERVVNLFQAGGIDDILAVVGHRASEVCEAIEPLKIRRVINPDYRQGMFASVLTGLRALPDQCRAFFIHPVDIPLVRPQTVQRLTAAFKNHSATVLYPTFNGRRGHPTLIRTCLVPSIMQWSGAGGLKGSLQCHEADSLELPVVDEAILQDLDTPGDYDRMRARLNTEGLPSGEECRVLMEQMRELPPPVADHCRAVSRVALQLAHALEAAGAAIDVELVRTAALLHDIARTEKNHAHAGAQLLASHGFSRLAPIVSVHMDLDVNGDRPLDEAQVVYLADKLVDGDRCVDMERRFSRQMETYSGNRGVVDAIVRRWENTRLIRIKVEGITGRPIEAIVADVNASLDGEKGCLPA